MIAKQDSAQTGNLLAVNKQILEIKKKIQLSEGRRKALFEEYEVEQKTNAAEISSLKGEIAELVIKLKENRSLSAKDRIQCRRLEEVVGHIGDKTCSEVRCFLDLQVTDKIKRLDLIRYQIRKKENQLKKIADEYQILISGKLESYTKIKLDVPVKKNKRELQNNIHATQVQWREAEHIRIRYREIKKALLEDAARFEANIKRTKQELQAQQIDIQRLQEVNNEANQMRSIARSNLQKEEKEALRAAQAREQQALDGKRLIVERRQELEKLEKKIFQTGKPPVRPEIEGEDSNVQTPTPPAHPLEEFKDDFETLKNATGGTTIDDVLERFLAQKETSARLSSLRKSGEENKKKLEGKHESLNAQLESLKFAEVKDTEENAEEVELLHEKMEREKKKMEEYKQSQSEIQNILGVILENVQSIFLNVAPDKLAKNNTYDVIVDLRNEIQESKERRAIGEEKKDVELYQEKWLPQPYTSLIRRTPIPQAGAGSPAPPPGSDEEEEVPSRGYMKRQAQIVVDAKSRRKSLRFPTKK